MTETASTPTPAPAAPLSGSDIERIRRSFMLGLNRDVLTLPDGLNRAVSDAGLKTETPLVALALAAQSQRFERPASAAPGHASAAAAPEAARLMREDPRAILPAPARRQLNRLLGATKTTIAQHVMWAALMRLNRRGLRLHPFDLPKFEPLLRANEVALGPAERALLSLNAVGDKDESEPASLLHETIGAGNWRSFSKPQRLAFLKELRLRDPAAGLALVEACFKEEAAAMRADLTDALEAGLSPGDQTFLESLEKDRTEKVRFNAMRLLGRIPGTDAYSKRIEKALKSLETKGPGVIVFRPPAGSKALAENMTRELFEGLGVKAVAGLLQMRPEEFIHALKGSASAMLLPVLIPSALAEGDESVIAALVDELSPAALMNAVSLMRGIHATFKPHACLAFAEGFMRRLDEASMIYALSLADLSAMIGGPLPVHLADAYLASSSWKRIVALLSKEETSWRDNCDPEIAFYTSLIMPSERMPQFLASLEPVRPFASRFAQDFAQFVLSLPGEDGAPNSDKR